MMIMASGAESSTLPARSEESMTMPLLRGAEDCIPVRCTQVCGRIIRATAYEYARGPDAPAPRDRQDGRRIMRETSINRDTSPAKLLALALLPMTAALAGASVDERLRLGVTVWRSACRSSGLAPGSVIAFTLELLPCAVIGALIGGLAVLAFAVRAASVSSMRRSLAAHLGCAVTMPVGVLLCAIALPLPLMLAADALLAGCAAAAVGWALNAFPGGAARGKYAVLRDR
jgi:hypothetical protein